MKRNRQNLIRLLLVGIIPLMALSACIKEREIGGGTAGKGESAVRFSVWLPGAAHASRSLTEDNESHVQTIDILMFAQGGGAWQYRAGVSGADITTDDTDAAKKTFTITMRHGDYDLVMLANARDKIVALDLAGKTKSQVLAMLAGDAPVGGKWIADDAAAGYKPIPMWGEIGDITIDDNTEITEAEGITLTRMVARVDVLIAAGVNDFKLTGVDVYNYNTKGSFAPLPTAWNPAANPPRATAPNVPSGSVLTKGPLEYNNGSGRSEINTAANKCEREIYLFEAENHTGAGHATGKDHLDRTCIVVGGVYDANGNGNFTDDGPATYYRADFSTGTGDAEAFLDVLRNHHYTFTVTKVNGPGYATSEDAFQGAKPIDFTVSVTNWGADQNVMLLYPPKSSNSFILSTGGEKVDIPVYSQIFWAMKEGGLTSGWMTKDMMLGTEIIWSENTNVIQGLNLIGTYNATAKLRVISGSSEGNAVVGVFNDLNSNGTREAGESILWSWHIWSCNANNLPQDLNGWMDRNLGAHRAGSWLSSVPNTEASKGDPILGLYYQWGRKDGFPNTDQPAYPGGITISSTDNNSLSVSITQPMNIITTFIGSNGTQSWDNGSTNYKTVYDPCPTGWRVPRADSWGDFVNWARTVNGYSHNEYGGYYPSTCYRNGSYVVITDIHAYYLSATSSSAGTFTSFMIRYQHKDIAPLLENSGKAVGAAVSVRCIRDM